MLSDSRKAQHNSLAHHRAELLFAELSIGQKLRKDPALPVAAKRQTCREPSRPGSALASSASCPPLAPDQTMLSKVDAQRECIRRWRALPREQRSTNEQASAFAASLLEEIVFPTSGDGCHFIRGWIQRDLQLRGGL